MDLGLKGKTAFIGASSKGLGRACAERLAAEGVRVAMCARNEKDLAAAADGIRRATGTEVVEIKADLSKADDIARAMGRAAEVLGDIDILVANNGGPPLVALDDLSDRHWLDAFELTHLSVVRLIRAVLPGMRRKKWGRLLAIQSSSIKQPVAGLHLSNGIRPAVAGLFKTMADDLIKQGITANIVIPGVFLTDRIIANQKAVAEKTGVTLEKRLDTLKATIPAGRFGKPEELGDMVLFLASERASYVTGAVIQVDGGLIRSVV